MASQCNYLYGVTRCGIADAFESAAGVSASLGSGLGGGDVRMVCHGGLAMVVSQAEPVRFSQLAPETTLRCLAEHQRVLERVMEESAVLPVKFGTYAADDGQVAGILDSGRADFTRALNRFGEMVELDLVAWWPDLGPVLAELSAEPEVLAMKGRLTVAATRDERVRLGQLVKGLLDDRRNRIAGELTAALSAEWSPLVANAIKDDSMILNVAALVRRGDQERFDRAVEGLDRRYRDQLSFRRVGPLPPYSFATVEVTLLGAAELDAARQTLELGEYANLDEIKAASRRLLREHHPDRNAAAGSAERVEQIAAAYELLERFARNVKHRLAGAAGAGTPVVKVCSLAELRAQLPGRAA